MEAVFPAVFDFIENLTGENQNEAPKVHNVVDSNLSFANVSEEILT